jgi:hypothetical protein
MKVRQVGQVAVQDRRAAQANTRSGTRNHGIGHSRIITIPLRLLLLVVGRCRLLLLLIVYVAPVPIPSSDRIPRHQARGP